MNKYDYIIRRETEKDYREVENLAREAFWNLNKPGCHEHYFIHILREHEDFIRELDHVVEADGKIVGSVMYCRSKLTDEQGNEKQVLTMGPLCVLPEYQRKGFGKALLEYTFGIAAEMGYDTVINFGNPDNYVARGYKSCKKYNVCFEGDVFPAALLVKVLRDDALDGRKWFYHPSDADKPCDDTEAVEAFDALFQPKVKGWQPSQEEFYIHSHSSITW
ncbi:GNAT family N-acetyltransferase [Ruminococcus flavefaciens]|uniref:N-acetyltransferase GCN5 n=1 Tax=Ruminococcus flavefaciens 007c TaxID=1341157 RepID=W7UYX4_RUMFL|nr:N-acetyltransferase [Ruminococcus flavefaciens]EWM53910.1 N-acetyltransferase GCN5 [Ruminococcus flavefaciens 007c]